MAARFGSPTAAIAFSCSPCGTFLASPPLPPCTANQWAIFVDCWTAGLAYWVAVFYYQIATFSQHPATAIAWLVVLAFALLSTLIGLKHFTRRASRRPGGDRASVKARPLEEQ